MTITIYSKTVFDYFLFLIVFSVTALIFYELVVNILLNFSLEAYLVPYFSCKPSAAIRIDSYVTFIDFLKKKGRKFRFYGRVEPYLK